MTVRRTDRGRPREISQWLGFVKEVTCDVRPAVAFRHREQGHRKGSTTQSTTLLAAWV